ARPFGAEALQGPALDRDIVGLQMRDRISDWSLPFEAEIAVAGLHRQPRHFRRLDAGTVHVELLVAETIGPAGWPLHQFRAHHLGIKPVRPLPLRDVNDAMIEFDGRHARITPPWPKAPRPASQSGRPRGKQKSR